MQFLNAASFRTRLASQAVLTGIVLYLCFGHFDGAVDTPPFPHFDKLVHAIMFGGWCGALLWTRQAAPWRWHPGWCVAAMILAGGLVEIVQPLFRRSGDAVDWLADIAGILAAWGFFKFFPAWFQARPAPPGRPVPRPGCNPGPNP